MQFSNIELIRIRFALEADVARRNEVAATDPTIREEVTQPNALSRELAHRIDQHLKSLIVDNLTMGK